MKHMSVCARKSVLFIAFIATSLLANAEGNRCCLDAVYGRIGAVAGPHTQDLVETSSGSGVTLPLAYLPETSCGEWLFAGWHAASPVNATTTAPTLIPAGSYMPSSNGEKLYAVYRNFSESYRWEKISDQSEIVAGGEYVFVVDTNNLAISVNGVSEHNRMLQKAVTISGNLITGGLTNYEIWRGVELNDSVVEFKNEETGYILATNHETGVFCYYVPKEDNDDDRFFLKQNYGTTYFLKYYRAVSAFRQTYAGDQTPFHIYKRKWTTYTSSPDCLPKMEAVGWDEDDSGNRYVTVESYVLHGAPSMHGAIGTSVLQADGTYRIQFDPAQLPPCSETQVEWDGTTTTLRVPYIIKDYATTSSLMGAKECDTCDVYVMSHGEILVNDNRSLNALTVHDGGFLSVSNNKTLTVNSLIFFAEGDQSAPVLNLNTGGHIVLANGALYHDRRIPQDRWYWLTVPYDVSSRELSYACEAANGGIPVYNTDYWVKYYDGAQRALDASTGKMSPTYWSHMAEKAEDDYTLYAGNGYQLGINNQDTVHFNGQDYTHTKRTMRFTMHPDPATWNISESGGTKTTSVVPSSTDNPLIAAHAGWNLIGNPYLYYYNLSEVAGSGQLHCGKWSKEMVNGVWTGHWVPETGEESIPYLTVYDPDTRIYSQVLASTFRELRPFEALFVQVNEDPMLSFDHPELIKSFKPLRAIRSSQDRLYTGITLSGRGLTDCAGIVLDNDLTSEYEVGADLGKLMGERRFSIYTFNVHRVPLAFNALSDEDAADTIPVGVVVPANGAYTFAFDAEQYSVNALESMQLIDKVTGVETDLLHGNYTLDLRAGVVENRFALLVRRTKEDDPVATSVGDVRNDDVQCTKVLRDGMLYIRNNNKVYTVLGIESK